MLKYFDDFVGKDLAPSVFAELILYFSINIMPDAIPLAILLSSLMTFGEHFELTAIKSAGISLKHPDNRTLKDVIIYDHTAEKSNYRNTGNLTVIVTDSAIMYTVYNDRYLKLELYKGNYYKEQRKGKVYQNLNSQYVRSQFDQMEMMFSLASFDFRESDIGIFQNNGKMKNIEDLSSGIDSINLIMEQRHQQLKLNILQKIPHHLAEQRKEIEEVVRQSKSQASTNTKH